MIFIIDNIVCICAKYISFHLTPKQKNKYNTIDLVCISNT